MCSESRTTYMRHELGMGFTCLHLEGMSVPSGFHPYICSASQTLYLRHELRARVKNCSNLVFELRRMSPAVGSSSRRTSTYVFQVTNYVHEQRTMYMSHELCTWVTNCVRESQVFTLERCELPLGSLPIYVFQVTNYSCTPRSMYTCHGLYSADTRWYKYIYVYIQFVTRVRYIVRDSSTNYIVISCPHLWHVAADGTIKNKCVLGHEQGTHRAQYDKKKALYIWGGRPNITGERVLHGREEEPYMTTQKALSNCQ